MNTNTFALSHSERGWLMLSVAFLMSGIVYGLIISRLTMVSMAEDSLLGLQMAPVLFLFSLSIGFMLVTTGHYVFRQSLRQPAKEEQW
jgi:uncharacterized membrane protein